MRPVRSIRTVGVIGVGVVAMTVLAGCRDREPDPPLNQNLGDKPGQLMPLGVAAADARILEDQKGITEEETGRPVRRASAKRAPQEKAEPKRADAADKKPKADKKAEPTAPKGGSLGDLLKKAEKKGAKPPAADKTPEAASPKGRSLADLMKKGKQKGAGPEAAKAEQFVRKLAAGQFEQAAEEFDATMRQGMPAAKLEGVWKAVVAQCGPFKTTQPGTTQQVGALTTVFVPCQFANANLQVKVVYNPKGKISGLWVQPAGAETAGKGPEAPKDSKASKGGVLGNLLKRAGKMGGKTATTKPAAKPTAKKPSSPSF